MKKCAQCSERVDENEGRTSKDGEFLCLACADEAGDTEMATCPECGEETEELAQDKICPECGYEAKETTDESEEA